MLTARQNAIVELLVREAIVTPSEMIEHFNVTRDELDELINLFRISSVKAAN